MGAQGWGWSPFNNLVLNGVNVLVFYKLTLTKGERQKSKKSNLFRAMGNKFYRWLLIWWIWYDGKFVMISVSNR